MQEEIHRCANRWIAAPLLARFARAGSSPYRWRARSSELSTQRVRPFGPSVILPGSTQAQDGHIISFTNFAQGGVAEFPPGRGSHGGRWAVWMATWTDPSMAHLITDFDDALALAAAGQLTIVRAPEADFRCPILPGNAHGTR